MLHTSGIKRFWELVRERISATTDPEEAGMIAMQAAMEAGIWRELGAWELEVRNTHQPNSYALEIARRNYCLTQQQELPELSKALYAFDHEEAARFDAARTAALGRVDVRDEVFGLDGGRVAGDPREAEAQMRRALAEPCAVAVRGIERAVISPRDGPVVAGAFRDPAAPAAGRVLHLKDGAVVAADAVPAPR